MWSSITAEHETVPVSDIAPSWNLEKRFFKTFKSACFYQSDTTSHLKLLALQDNFLCNYFNKKIQTCISHETLCGKKKDGKFSIIFMAFGS